MKSNCWLTFKEGREQEETMVHLILSHIYNFEFYSKDNFVVLKGNQKRIMKIPAGHQTIMPYLMLKKAADFYTFVKEVFHANEIERRFRDNGEIIMHSEIEINGCTIMYCEAVDNWKQQNANLFIYVEDADQTFEKAILAGSKIMMPLTDQDYGRTCGIEDPFGNTWWITSISAKPTISSNMKINAGIITEKLLETKEFYTSVLGFGVTFENEFYLLLHTPNKQGELSFLLPNHPGQQKIFQKPFLGEGIYLTIEVEDVDAVYEEMKDRKQEITIKLRDEPGGDRHFAIVDPNGIGIDFVTFSAP